ncbi:glucosaminidase domain-containing protein [Chondrinema litorale]|uniref:glucosaminidase domain-containing protein n=1 Tax=Chondrinema litorale TaxID=2994555 RepID=UPI002543FAF4|nr:glucosaminidase domain-containing protein [Chondrinema litorale]UZR93595.1 glucosaminidase domain-containing protein [Chondrinema litorale]
MNLKLSLTASKFLLLSTFLLTASFSQAQRSANLTADQYINLYKDAAIQNMYESRIPASITLAQGMLESGNGNSQLAKKANNHFGIKCHSDWKGKSVRMDDDKKNECFRKYDKVLDSYRDHADFLSNRERYSILFSLEITDYKGWAKGLKKAGYATSPTYANKLIDIIERYKLFKYDSNSGGTGTGGKILAGRIADITKINKIKAIIVLDGETKLSLATAVDKKVKQIEKYNELGTGDELYVGQVIYLQNKRSKATKGNDIHTVQIGETMYDIAQQYGIKYTKLLKRNNMWYASEINPGDVVYLRKNKPTY